MQNIDLFDEYTARIFALLYERFPVKQSLDVRELCGHSAVNDFGIIVDERGRPSRAFDIAMATVEWLGDNGYVRLDRNFGHGWTNVVLTAQGLEALSAVPESLASKESFGDRLVRFVREGAFGLAKEAAKAALAAAAGRIASC